MQISARTFRNFFAAALSVLLAMTLLPTPPAGAVADPAELLAADEVPQELEDFVSLGRVQTPTAAQLAAAGQPGLRVSWNEFGTPQSVFNRDGSLASGLSDDAVEAARQYLSQNLDLFGVPAETIAGLELLNDSQLTGSSGHAVLFRQTFGGLPVTEGGLVTVGIVDGEAVYASSSLSPARREVPAPAIEARLAVVTALQNAGFKAQGSITADGTDNDWTRFQVPGLSEAARTRLTALPTYDGQVRPAFETLVTNGDYGLGYRTFIDAITGEVLIRYNLVDHATDNPRWKYFKLYPKLEGQDDDIRVLACWSDDPDFDLPCPLEVGNEAAEVQWDVDGRTGQPTFTTKGNAANTSLSSLSPFTPSENYRPVSPEREYIYDFNDHWRNSKCSREPQPDPGKSDVDAAIVSLFSNHNRMHDWSYRLGFTEENYNMQEDNFGRGGRPGDPEVGNAQAGYLTGGFPSYTGRDNANQITPNDGVPPITNMYLWQPVPGAFYADCVDGDFDQSVIGHEYTHAISNRMVGGPDAGLTSRQAGSMGESWSDLVAMEYINEYGYAPVGKENPYTVGAYVTGNKKTGIRNYAMNKSPLNFSDVGYDLTGPQVHADGEIWSATNFELRKAFIKKYNKNFPASDLALQERCAEGEAKLNECPGNRRWMQVVFDAWLLMPARTSFLDARDAYFAADKMRTQSAHKNIMWKVFAKRGFGQGAKTEGGTDEDVKPSFKSPVGSNGTLRFKAVNAAGKTVKAQFYVGRYQARVTPVANFDPKFVTSSVSDPLPIVRSANFVPGKYQFIARADGYGMMRFKDRVLAGRERQVVVRLQKNLASKSNKAKATGPGFDVENLIDDTEATNWGADGRVPTVKGTKVTVDLAGKKKQLVRWVQVSAMLRPRRTLPTGDADPGDPTQNRFQALRQFKIKKCVAKESNGNCALKGFKTIYKSRANAFPGGSARPLAPNLIMRRFKIPATRATHLRLVVVHNQCTGNPHYAGETDSDPAYATDCQEGSAQDNSVRAAEFQVFGRLGRLVRR